MNSDTALRERVFQLVCENWIDEAIPDAEGALGDLLRVLEPGDELRKALGGFIHWDDGSWLERIARTCFNLPFNDTGEAPEWKSLLAEIGNSIGERT